VLAVSISYTMGNHSVRLSALSTLNHLRNARELGATEVLES